MNRQQKPGRKAEFISLPDPSWQDAVKRALEKPRPEGGWPDEPGKKAPKPAKPGRKGKRK